jgi:hypothetical protein
MTVKRIVTAIAVFLAFIAMTSANVGAAAAEPDLPPCQTNPWRSEVVQEFSEGSWGYLYRLIWCVEDTQITWVVADVVPVLPDDSDCTWNGPLENSLGPVPNSDNWLGFTMGWFSCPTADGTNNDFPWGIIHVRPDGTSDIQDQGTSPPLRN